MGVNLKPTQRYGVPVLGKQDEQRAGMYLGGEVALQAFCGGFNSHPVHQNLSGCIVSLVDGRAWNSEGAGAEPATQTRYIDRNAQRCAAGLLIRVRLVRSQFGQPNLPL